MRCNTGHAIICLCTHDHRALVGKGPVTFPKKGHKTIFFIALGQTVTQFRMQLPFEPT